MSEIVTNKITPSTGSSDTVTLGDSGDTFNIPSGATITNSGTATGFLPAVGSSGNVLTSDGTNWASTAPAGGGASALRSLHSPHDEECRSEGRRGTRSGCRGRLRRWRYR